MGGYFSKRRLKKQQRTGDAIGRMQAQWEEDRRQQLLLAESRIHAREKRLNDASVLVQSHRRRQLGQREANRRRAAKRAEKEEGRHVAARRIQEHWRQRGITKWVKLFSLVAQIIQPVQRGSAARHRHLLEGLYLDPRPSCAVGPARKVNRGWPRVVRPCGVFRRWAAAARVVQRYWHGMLGRRAAWAVRCERSAVWLQCVVRTMGPKAELVRRRRRHAATVIQAHTRRHWQQVGGWHARSVPACGRHAALTRRIARSGVQGLWRGYWYRTTRRRAFARDTKTLLALLARIGLMRHRKWLFFRQLSLDQLSEVHGEWQLGGSPDSSAPYPALVGGWGLNPSSDRYLLLNACRSERHKWLKMKKAVAMGAAYSRLYKDQAVTLVQAMYRGQICRRKMQRAALRDASLIKQILEAAHLSRLWPKLRKLGVTWDRLRCLGEAQLGGHVKLAWRSHAIPWGLTPSDASRLADLLFQCAVGGSDAVLVAATKRYNGHNESMKRAEQARAAALAAVQEMSREAIAERKALRRAHLQEKEHERSKELAARLAVFEASAAREEAVAAAAVAMASRQADEMYRAMALLDEVYGESWRAVAREDIPTCDSDKWRSALRESMDMALRAENGGELLGDECVAAARALGLCQEHVDGLALKLSTKLRKQLPPLEGSPVQDLSSPDRRGVNVSPAAQEDRRATDLNRGRVPAAAVLESDRRQMRAVRRALRALPPLIPGKAHSGDTSEISRLLTDREVSPGSEKTTAATLSVPRLGLPLPSLLQLGQGPPERNTLLASGVLDVFRSPEPARTEWGRGGPRTHSAAPSKWAPAAGAGESPDPHTVLVRYAKATVTSPPAGMLPNGQSSLMERQLAELARPFTPLLTPPSGSIESAQHKLAELGSSVWSSKGAPDLGLSEFTGSFEERLQQRDVKERREMLEAEGTVPKDGVSGEAAVRDGTTWVEIQAADLLQEWKVRQKAMLRFQISDLRTERPRNRKMETRFMVTQLIGWLLRGDAKEVVVPKMRTWVQEQVDIEAAILLRDSEFEQYRVAKQQQPTSWFDPGMQAAEVALIQDYEAKTKAEMEAIFGF